jgi:hypothetical protein
MGSERIAECPQRAQKFAFGTAWSLGVVSPAAMFCPQCRAEYRPGFIHCSDCDVDLVDGLSDSEKLKAWAGPRLEHLPTVKKMYTDGRKTVHWWAIYKRQTGRWPWSSVAIHLANWIVVLLGGLFLLWWTIVERHLSRWQVLGVFLLLGLPYTILEQWAKRRLKLNYVRSARRLVMQQKQR